MRLFESAKKDEGKVPLAERMRPSDFSEFVGQEKLLGDGAPLRRLIDTDRVPSMILWGPPGCGKTTIAHLVAKVTKKHFVAFSAVTASVADVKRIVAEAKHRPKGSTLLLIDEIHRFNKAQQGVLLPHIEDGTLILIGATTSFEVIAPLLSRCHLYTLRRLTNDEVETILNHAIESERGLAGKVDVTPEALSLICACADGDARVALNILEMSADTVGSDRRSRIEADDVRKEGSVARQGRRLPLRPDICAS